MIMLLYCQEHFTDSDVSKMIFFPRFTTKTCFSSLQLGRLILVFGCIVTCNKVLRVLLGHANDGLCHLFLLNSIGFIDKVALSRCRISPFSGCSSRPTILPKDSFEDQKEIQFYRNSTELEAELHMMQ